MDPMDHAKMAFRYREEATGRKLPCDPDWPKVMQESIKPAMAGERGDTDQQQCAYQAIRLDAWESGRVLAPWTKAFLPALVIQVVWYRRWWAIVVAWYQSFLKRLHDLI